MRSGIRGVLSGALALIALQVLVQTPAATRVAGLFKVPAAVARWFIDPAIPAIPDTRRSEQSAGARKAGEAAFGAAKAVAAARSAYPDPFAPPQFTPVGGD